MVSSPAGSPRSSSTAALASSTSPSTWPAYPTSRSPASPSVHAFGVARLLIGLSLGYFLVTLNTLTFAAFLLTAGAWSGGCGARRGFSLGLLAFAVLSGLSALSFSTPALVALRALLGVAGALLVPSSLSLLAAAHPVPSARAKAMGVWAAVSGTGLVAGPLLGGLLTQAFGWRAIFVVNVPVAALAWALSRPGCPAARRRRGGGVRALAVFPTIARFSAVCDGTGFPSADDSDGLQSRFHRPHDDVDHPGRGRRCAPRRRRCRFLFVHETGNPL